MEQHAVSLMKWRREGESNPPYHGFAIRDLTVQTSRQYLVGCFTLKTPRKVTHMYAIFLDAFCGRQSFQCIQ